MWVKEVELEFPIKIGDKEIGKVRFRRPKAKDIKRMKISDEQELDEILKIAGNTSDLPHQNNIYELDYVDTQEVIEVVSGFLTNGPKRKTKSLES